LIWTGYWLSCGVHKPIRGENCKFIYFLAVRLYYLFIKGTEISYTCLLYYSLSFVDIDVNQFGSNMTTVAIMVCLMLGLQS
jgi:hypothetical protein